MSLWHELDVASTVASLTTDPARGLTASDTLERRATFGPNALAPSGMRTAGAILREQLTATMVLILVGAAALSFAVGDETDAIVILAIVLLNAALGFGQDYRAERAMAALQQLAVPAARVRRDGHVIEIPARDLVPGDVMLLEAGNLVGADGRVIESARLQVRESALTGEAEPVAKDPDARFHADAPLGDRRNMVYMGTVVTQGRGVAIITETGMRTELGRIAARLQTVARDPTPLQRRLDQLGRGLAAAALAIVAFVFLIGLFHGEHIRTMFLTAVSMAVAAVPEGLPAVVTIALALGAQRMLRRQALVRRLSAVETLGSVTIICADKTGTLTENRMRVTAVELADGAINIAEPPAIQPAPLVMLLAGAALCNDAIVDIDHAAVGDPTEVALALGAAQFGLSQATLTRGCPRVAEAAFDSVRKRMSTVHVLRDRSGPLADALRQAPSDDTGAAPAFLVFTKGAADRILEVSSRVWTRGGLVALDPERSDRIAAANDRLAADGMRVLGVGARWLAADPGAGEPDRLERDLVFLGLIALMDPPRAAALAAVATCKQAGIRAVMITGDHPLTARHIARQLGIADHRIVSGAELEATPDAALAAVVADASLYARVSPEHKLRLVDAFQRAGHVVAMTGDGVNDAPALKKASIGVAMGLTGTDVAKEAADMVLLDDNFATIVAAIEEGRVIYDNIRKFVKYLVTTNSAELLIMAIGPLAGMPLPLLPLQILWINLVTDGPTALMLGIEPAEPDVMRRPPTRVGDRIFSPSLVRHVVLVGLLMTAVCVAPGYSYWRQGNPAWQTMVFTTVALAQMAHVLAIRSNRVSLFQLGLWSNRPLLITVVVATTLHFTLVYAPVAQRLFGTVALSPGDVAASVALAAIVFAAVEIEKWWLRSRAAAPSDT